MKHQALGHRLFLLVLFAAVTTACGSVAGGEDDEGGNGPEMRPGENCNRCHSFAVAGTLFGAADASASDGVSGGTITINDAAGKTVTMSSNAAGNFFSSKRLTLPLKASVTKDGVTKTMTSDVTSGACASCHASPPAGGAPGRLYIGQ